MTRIAPCSVLPLIALMCGSTRIVADCYVRAVENKNTELLKALVCR